MIVYETSQSRRIIEILRLIITCLVYIELIDGRYWISWFILLTTPLCIWYYPIQTEKRTLGIMLGLFCPLTLLSASYEPLFFITLAINLISWLEATSTTSKSLGEQKITENLIKATFFVSFYHLLEKSFKRHKILRMEIFTPGLIKNNWITENRTLRN